MKKLLDYQETAGKSKVGYQFQEEKMKPITQPATEFIFEIRQFEYPIIQRIGARTGHYFIKTDQDWYRDVESKTLPDLTTPSYVPSWVKSDRLSIGSQSSQLFEQIGFTEEQPLLKPSEILKEFNISEKIKQEKIKEESKRQSYGRILTDSIINELESQDLSILQQSYMKPISPSRQDRNSLGTNNQKQNTSRNQIAPSVDASLYQILDNLPFQTPSKISEFSGAFSRSKGHITFHLDISPINPQGRTPQEKLLIQQKDDSQSIKNLPPLDPLENLRRKACADFFVKKTNRSKNILVLVNEPPIYLFDRVSGLRLKPKSNEIIDEGPPIIEQVETKFKTKIKVKPKTKKNNRKQRITDDPVQVTAPQQFQLIESSENLEIKTTSTNSQFQGQMSSPQFHKGSLQVSNQKDQNEIPQFKLGSQAICNFTFREELDNYKRENSQNAASLEDEWNNLNYVDQIYDEGQIIAPIQQNNKKEKVQKNSKKSKKMTKKNQNIIKEQTEKILIQRIIIKKVVTPESSLGINTFMEDIDKYKSRHFKGVRKPKEIQNIKSFQNNNTPITVENQYHDECLDFLRIALLNTDMTSQQTELAIKSKNQQIFLTLRVLPNQQTSFSVRRKFHIYMVNFHYREQVIVYFNKNNIKSQLEHNQIVGRGLKVRIQNHEDHIIKIKFHFQLLVTE